MMTLAALLLGQPAATAAMPDRIVVMAERLRTIEASVGQDERGRWRCSLSETSGNARLDMQVCRAATECAREHGNDREAIGWCIDQERSGIVADFRRHWQEYRQ